MWNIHRAKTDREFTIKTYAKYTTAQHTAVLQKAYDFYVGKIVDRAPYVDMQGMQNALDEVAKTIPAATNARPERFVDSRFLERLEKSGLLNELYR